MTNYREILRLYSLGLNKTQIAECVSRSENRSCTGFEPHSRRLQNRTLAACRTAPPPLVEPHLRRSFNRTWTS